MLEQTENLEKALDTYIKREESVKAHACVELSVVSVVLDCGAISEKSAG